MPSIVSRFVWSATNQLLFSCAALLGCRTPGESSVQASVPGVRPAPVSGYRVVATLPHSVSSFTEGFFYLNGLFYESTGLKGHSELRVTFPKTGDLKLKAGLSPDLFGEGIVDVGRYIYQWTWQAHRGIIYSNRTLQQVGSFTYSGEGWGMTRDDSDIITSDGSATLSFRNPASFTVTRQITVRDAGQPVPMLNELEYIKGSIYANVWHTNRIARISPSDGRLLEWIDLSGLEPDAEERDPEAVLNGIAYDQKGDRMFVTGKLWKHIYQIEVVPPTK
ncbi:Glutamine cyclotransferase [Bryocella elongata]|uniref:Glutamine cyclotransferase n=1 Tax=Bryocella elongata TaxID=863522 RepID=A0A1H6BS35_9BACT|nr:glutaminyl-peptide cyclotransferase [Bryocella elongata]SEG63255.1 Glutamine cyclotransferase [Bryocella elongata]